MGYAFKTNVDKNITSDTMAKVWYQFVSEDRKPLFSPKPTEICLPYINGTIADVCMMAKIRMGTLMKDIDWTTFKVYNDFYARDEPMAMDVLVKDVLTPDECPLLLVVPLKLVSTKDATEST